MWSSGHLKIRHIPPHARHSASMGWQVPVSLPHLFGERGLGKGCTGPSWEKCGNMSKAWSTSRLKSEAHGDVTPRFDIFRTLSSLRRRSGYEAAAIQTLAPIVNRVLGFLKHICEALQDDTPGKYL